MNILYTDFFCNCWGHKRLNKEFIKYLSTFACVDILTQKNWYKELPSGVYNIEMKKEYYQTGRFLSRINSLKMMLKARQLDKKKHYDYIFTSSYDTVAFGLGRLFFQNPERFFIMHHNNLDGIQRKSVDLIFRSYANKVNHLVLEKFIGKYLMEYYDIRAEQINYLPHPMNKNSDCNLIKDFDAVGISNSNDEEIVSKIISYEKETTILKRKRKKVLLRSQKIEFDDGYLKVIKGYLEDNTYNEYINRAKSILVLFPLSFRNRVSGTIIDALSNHIKICGTEIPIVKEFEKKYPCICKSFSTINELIDFISNDVDDYEEQFAEFEKEHTDDTIITILKVIFW